MCAINPRNCALRDGHGGPCVSLYELNRLVGRGIAELLGELDRLENSDG